MESANQPWLMQIRSRSQHHDLSDLHQLTAAGNTGRRSHTQQETNEIYVRFFTYKIMYKGNHCAVYYLVIMIISESTCEAHLCRNYSLIADPDDDGMRAVTPEDIIKEGIVMIKRTIFFVALMLLVMLIPFSVMAEEMSIRPVEEILSEIKQEQGVTTNEQIDAAKISSDKLEELGDAVMEELIGNHAMHERMDVRLGGDGSAALSDYHKALAVDYLAGAPLGMMGMMRRGSRGSIRGSWPQTGINGRMGNNMMGYGWSGIGWIGMILAGLVVLIAIVLIVFLVARLSHGSVRSGENHMINQQPDSAARALDILSERYAKGELSDEEYAKKKAELRK